MTTYKLAPLKAAAIRVTLLDSCGVPSTGANAMFASKNLVAIEQSGETIEAVEFPLTNADGDLELYQTDAARLKYLSLDIQVSQVVAELVNWLTGDDMILDNAVSPSVVGWQTQTNSSSIANAAIEVWTRLAGVSSCSGTGAYGYLVWPWIVNGTMHAWKTENGLTELKIMGQTKAGSPWGTGPYSVNLSKAAATLGQPMALFEPVLADAHRVFQRTEMPPPAMSTYCGPTVGTMVVVDDDAGGPGLAATATIPLPLVNTTPGYIYWGDATPNVLVAAGAATAAHVYAAAGTYTCDYRPLNYSDVVYHGTVTMA